MHAHLGKDALQRRYFTLAMVNSHSISVSVFSIDVFMNSVNHLVIHLFIYFICFRQPRSID